MWRLIWLWSALAEKPWSLWGLQCIPASQCHPHNFRCHFKSHFEAGNSLGCIKLPSNILFLSELALLVCVNSQAIFRRSTHKPFWIRVVIHLGGKKGAIRPIRNTLRFGDDIRQRYLSLEKLWPSHISVHSQITGRASALIPPNAFLPKSVCSSFSRGFLLFSGNMSVLNGRLLWNGVFIPLGLN